MRDEIVYRADQPKLDVFKDTDVTCELKTDGPHTGKTICRVNTQSLVPTRSRFCEKQEPGKYPWISEDPDKDSRDVDKLVKSIPVGDSYAVALKDGHVCVKRLCSKCDGDHVTEDCSMKHERGVVPDQPRTVSQKSVQAWMSLVKAKSDDEATTFKKELFDDTSKAAIVKYTSPGQSGYGKDVLRDSLLQTDFIRYLTNDAQFNGQQTTYDFIPMYALNEKYGRWDGNKIQFKQKHEENAVVSVDIKTPFVVFMQDLGSDDDFKKNRKPTEDEDAIIDIKLNIGPYTLCAIMGGLEGHFATRVLTPKGWYNLDCNNVKNRYADPPKTTEKVSVLLYTRLETSKLPDKSKYVLLTRKGIARTCFINAAVHIFKLIWLCIQDGKVLL